MFSSILKIDGRFYKEDEINQIIKCPSCLNIYVDPRMLPCGDTICLDCVKAIREESGLEEIQCPVCQEVHKIPDETLLARNKALEELSNKQAHEIYRNESVEDLKSHLREIQSKAELFQYSLDFPEQQIREYCETLRNTVDLSRNKLKQELDEASDALFKQIDAYEKECMDSFKELQAENNAKMEKFKEKTVEYKDSLGEINSFLFEKVNYLKELEIDNRQVQNSIEMSKQKLLDLEKQLVSFNSYLFKQGQMEFISNNKEMKLTEVLGKLRLKQNSSDLSGFKHMTRIDMKLRNEYIIRSIEFIDEERLLVLANVNSTFYAFIVNRNGEVLKEAIIYNFNLSLSDFIINSACSSDKIILCVHICRKSQRSTNKHNLANTPTQLFIFDSDLNELVGAYTNNERVECLALNESKFYCVLSQSKLERNNQVDEYKSTFYLGTYDYNLKRINSLGLEAYGEQDPYYISAYISEFKVFKGRFYFLENFKKRVKVMNESTGFVELVFAVEASSFSIYKQSCLLFYEYNSSVTYFDFNGNKIFGTKLREEVAKFDTKHLVNDKIIAFNKVDSSQIVILS